MMLRRFALASVLLIASSAAPAMAATNNADLDVSAEIVANCTIATAPLDFSAYDPIVANKTTAYNVNASVTTNCTTGAVATITLGQGTNDTAGTPDAPQRQLKSGANLLPYYLYQDAGRATVWGNTALTGVLPITDGTNQISTVYGQVPANQNVPVGTYTDTVVATVTF
ncbi:MAG: spore coat protein U domain-containing protein [Nostoc sp. NMS7]|uniref:Csu type fimbrial protein n=1 Tax=Nostoc sp. NMS7 TaxID=2815391 RepID=UPI0025F532DC|nr:spore coat U domain-containing protein [Nostoc sp. NMS7]MBN3945447.1 spore coat protein U domain-containing protein [Nostoc sp. NMS7]